MIRQYNNRTVQVENGVTKYLADIFCNSTDTKPTANLVNGSKLTEVDTGKTYLFDEVNEEWTEYSEGGGSGSGGGVEVVTFTDITPASDTVFTATASMTGTEILTAILEGKSVNAVVDGRNLGLGVLQIPMMGINNDLTQAWGKVDVAWSTQSLETTRIATLYIPTDSNNARLSILGLSD